MHKKIILMIAILFLYTGVVLATPGDLDFTFNSPHGFVTYDSGGHDYAGGVAIQNDGKIIIAGSSVNALLLRYNTDGTLDSTFGSGGVVTYSGGRFFALTVAVQDDGKIVVGGSDSFDDLLLLRYNSNGTLDDTFGSSGVVTYDMGLWDSRAKSIAMQADGKIVVGGEYFSDIISFLILRYDTDGTLDNTFGTGGRVFVYDSEELSDLAIQSDGKIIVTGSSTGEENTPRGVIVVRLNSDGTPDSSFGTGGQVIYDGGLTEFGQGLVLQNDGKIIIVGYSLNSSREIFGYYEILLLRYNNNGTLDNSFGTGGVAIYDLTPFDDFALSVNIDITERIIVLGKSGNNMFITRFNNNGTLDATFGNDGIVAYGFGGNGWSGQDGLALQADGKIVIAGNSFNGIDYDVLILRLLSDTPDTPPICGDSYLDSSEQCDDGNTINGDGCSSTCQIEAASSVAVVPTIKRSFFYPAVSTRVMNMIPSIAKPVGVGSVAHGGDFLKINIGLFGFSGLIDIYGAYTISTDPQTVNILNPNGSSFTSFTISEIVNALLTGVPPVGFQPWKANAEGPIDINPLGTIPVSILSSDTYTVYLLVTPAGILSSYYLWITSFVIP
ncbi:MAG: DUF4215 domain-containing protein [Candidatus Hodarchaeales archaeon]|jgi:uncharacterized delta-60 repeat protein